MEKINVKTVLDCYTTDDGLSIGVFLNQYDAPCVGVIDFESEMEEIKVVFCDTIQEAMEGFRDTVAIWEIYEMTRIDKD